MSDTRVSICVEPVWASWARDFGSFGVIILSFWLNHKFMDDNGWLNSLLFIFALIGLCASSIRNTKHYPRFTTEQDAIAFLQKRIKP